MRKLKLFFACLLMAVLSIGQVWGAEQVAYTLEVAATGGNSAPHNSYTAAATTTISGIEWSVLGNSSMNPWRLGGKESNCSGVDRDVHSNTAISDNISKIEIAHGTASSITVNSMTIIVSKNSDFSNPVSTLTPTFVAEDVVTINRPAGKDWSNCYYKFVYNLSVTGNSNRFVQFMGAVFYKETGGTPTCATPTFSPAAGAVLSGTEVSISCATEGATIHYTTDGTEPTASSPTYSSAITIDEAKTIKAIAVKGGLDNSSVASAAYTVLTPLTTMDQIFAAAGTIPTQVAITFNNWVVTGVKNSNAYVTDGTKGFIIYASGHGFAVGNILSGTAICKVQLYNGSAELTDLTSSTTGLSVTTGGTASVNVLDAEGIAALTGANTGSVIKISGECSEVSSKFYIGGVQLYNTLYSFSVSGGTSYECTGVYLQYNSTKEILPRSADDIVVSSGISVTSIDLTESTASVEAGETVTLHASVAPEDATNKTIVWSVESGDTYASVDQNGVVTGLAAGTAVIRAASDENASIYEECTVTVTAADPTKHVVTFDATVDKGESPLSKSNITFTCSSGVLNNGTEYRLYKSSTTTFACSVGNIIKVEFTGVSGNPVSGFGDPEEGTLVTDGNDGVWTGNAASVSFVASGAQVRATEIKVTYKEDSRAEAGLAWNPADDIEITVGDAFSAPTLLNPNSIDAAEITIESNNESLATVTAGVVALVADATGEATITATFAGNDDYKPATVSYNITVNAAAPVVLTDYYEKVTSGAVAEGTYLIVYEDGENSLAFNGGLETLDAESNTIAVTITNDNKIGVTTETAAATFYIDPVAGTVKSASNHYIGVSSWSNGLKQTDTYVHNVLEIDGDGNAQVGIYKADWNTTGGTMRLQYNKGVGQTRFRYFKNGGQQPIALYKLHDEVIKPAAGLAWNPSDNIEITVGDAFTAPTLLNPNSIDAAEISIESSNTSLATVTAGVVELVADATGTATITATFAGNASYKEATVSYTIKVNPASSIYVSPSLNVNFGSVEKDAALPADQTITVTLNNVDAATATLGGTNPEAFNVDKTALTASGDITISVVSSATVGEFKATLTISDDASAAASKEVKLSFTVTDPASEETPISTSTEWIAATEITDGMQVLITGVKDEVVYAMGEQKSTNRAAYVATLNEGVLTPGEGTMAFTLVAQGDGTYAIRTSNGKYLYAAASGSNHLKTQDEVDVNAKWTMTVASAVAEGSSNRNVMQFNGGSSKLFSCYASASQEAIKLYVPYVAPVAQIETTGYTTLAAAVAAANANDVVKLLDNVDLMATGLEIAENITLDLNGFNIKAGEQIDNDIFVPAGKKLTLVDNSENHLGKIYTEQAYTGAVTGYGLIRVAGELLMQSGNIYAVIDSDPANLGQFAVVIAAGGKVTVEGGQIKAGWYAISNNGLNSGSTIIVSGGELISTADFAIYNPAKESTVTVSGGVVYGAAGGIAMNRGELTVTGGTITSKDQGTTGTWGDGTGGLSNAAISASGKYESVEVEISGGTIIAEGTAVMITNGTTNPVEIAISGGQFSHVVPAEYCAPGFAPVTEPNTQGKYEVEEAPFIVERTGLTIGWYYTMCMEKAVSAVHGGTIWRVLSKAENSTDVILEEVTGILEAGRPYIFQATAESLEVQYYGVAVGAPVTTGNNGLIGSFTQEEITISNDNYIIYNNELYYVNSLAYVGAHRAYLYMPDVPAYSPAAPAPGIRRVHMAVHGQNTTTGVENLNAGEAPVKMIINGQLFILRGEKMYNANGQLVK